MEETQSANQEGRDDLSSWALELQKNVYTEDKDFIHSINFHFPAEFNRINAELETFGHQVAVHLEPLVKENNLPVNLPRLGAYNQVGERIDKIVHHPSYIQAGNIIYGSRLMEKMSRFGGLTECLSFLFLSAHTGEAGHNCPAACSAGIIRVLQKTPDFPDKTFYLQKLTDPTFETAFTGAQFLTEIQGGSDVGLNATYATQDENNIWRIHGEKWFCSNAGANLIFITARYNEKISGTKGLGLFLVPAEWNGVKNNYTIRRLKDKLGTRSMATGEIDFHGAHALAIGSVTDGIHLVMDNVLHLSRLFNAFCVLGMARRAYFIANAYARHRKVFGNYIANYPLVKENLALMRAENMALLAGTFATAKLQDQLDIGEISGNNEKLLLRLLVNMQKYLTALWSVEHIHHAVDVLAGNGTIETFSPLPRLLRDSIICENWEGTHNVLCAQIHKDILKYDIDAVYITFMAAEVAKLKKYSQHLHTIIVELTDLKEQLSEFRHASAEMQSLQIRHIVHRMAIVFCALMLLGEAVDQAKNGLTFAKLDCYHYFCMLHLDKNAISYDNDYLELISRIVTIDTQ